jgi:hypothetical protein
MLYKRKPQGSMMTHTNIARFSGFTAVTMKTAVFCGGTIRDLVERYQRVGGSWCLHYQSNSANIRSRLLRKVCNALHTKRRYI